MKTVRLIACPDCDLLQLEPSVDTGRSVCCSRCNAVLYRNVPDSIEHTLAYALGAAVLFILANTFPIVGMEIEGRSSTVNLPGAVRALWAQDMQLVAGLVGTTTLLVPCLELSVMLYLLVPLRLGRMARGAPLILRTLEGIEPWGMVEVFMLGVLVAVVKLGFLAKVVPGIALWAYAALILLFTAMAASFNRREIWAHIGAAG